LLLATVTRFAVDPDGASLRLVGAKKGVRPIHLQAPAPAPVPTPSLEKPKRPKRQETPVPTLPLKNAVSTGRRPTPIR
jgi:hypothetical protein